MNQANQANTKPIAPAIVPAFDTPILSTPQVWDVDDHQAKASHLFRLHIEALSDPALYAQLEAWHKLIHGVDLLNQGGDPETSGLADFVQNQPFFASLVPQVARFITEEAGGNIGRVVRTLSYEGPSLDAAATENVAQAEPEGRDLLRVYNPDEPREDVKISDVESDLIAYLHDDAHDDDTDTDKAALLALLWDNRDYVADASAAQGFGVVALEYRHYRQARLRLCDGLRRFLALVDADEAARAAKGDTL